MEFALCLPVIAIIVFGTLEACEMVYLKQSVTIAAYEGVRTAIVPDVESGSVTVVAEQILSDRGVSGATISVTPNDFTTVVPGTYVSVEITAPTDGNSFTAFFTAGSEVSGRVEMMKEF